MMRTIDKNKWDVFLAPETTGKHSALGSLDETLRLVKETGCKFTTDPAHLYARNYGKIDFGEVLDKLEKTGHNHFHFHFSGISFTAKGERNHEILDHNPDFRPFAREVLDRGLDVTVVSESPITWKDSLKMKAILEGMGHRF
jgi:deoxyribonuclease-4